MKTSMVQMDMPKIEINGKAFELKQSDGDVNHNAREALAQCARLNTRDPDAVLTVLKEICGVIDDALGAGAVKQIVGDKPVSLPMALKILNTIIETCNARYKKYIQDEYLRGERNEKLQPVKP